MNKPCCVRVSLKDRYGFCVLEDNHSGEHVVKLSSRPDEALWSNYFRTKKYPNTNTPIEPYRKD